MLFQDDKSGQVMLTSAFLFAIIIAIIAIMLNNLIYSNNVAYLGFMGQSNYDELSIKQMTTDAAAYAFVKSNGNLDVFSAYMRDYSKAINSITIQKGRYIQIFDNETHGSPTATQLSPATTSKLSIYGKDSSKTYLIKTNYYKPTSIPVPTGGRDPGNVIVKIGSNTSVLSINDPGRYALLIVEVINSSTFMPEPGVTVKLIANGGHMTWGTYEAPNVLPVSPFEVVTDYYGKAAIIYDSADIGQKLINASVGTIPSRASKNLSNNVSITVMGTLVTPGACTAHPVIVGNPTPSYSTSHSSDFVQETIRINIDWPYDFEGNSPRFTVTLALSDGNNLQQISTSSQYLKEISDNHVKSATTNYDDTVWIKLKRTSSQTTYSGTLTVTVTAHCNIDGGDYSLVVTKPIIGTWPT